MLRKKPLISLGILGLGLAVSGLLFGWPHGPGEPAPPPASAPPAPREERPAPPPRGEMERALKVGVIGPQSGEEAAYGRRVLGGILMAAKRFNQAGGIGGRQIEVLHYDNESNPQYTQQIAAYLIKQKVAAIFSAPTGWSAFGPTHLANQSATLFITVGTRRKIGRGGGYVFNYALPDETAIRGLLKFAVGQAGYVNFALVTSSAYDFSLTVSALFKRSAPGTGGRIVTEADTYDTFSGTTDFGPVLAAVRASPEPLHALIFTGRDKQGASLALALRAAGIDLPIIGGEDLFTQAYLKQGGAAVNDSLVYASFSPHRDTARVAEFMRDVAATKGARSDRFTALAYDAFTLVARAIGKAGSTRSSAVRKALLEANAFDGATGKTRWTPGGSPIKQPFIHRVEKDGAGSKFVLLRTETDL